ncbi:MAG: UDP-N-acetylglucosamine 1-carboxyvinyltransferase [Clostridia bacterium]
MAKYIINGGKPLQGSLAVQGAKNSVLPLFAAALLTDEKVRIHNCPDLADVTNMGKILRSLGAEVERHGNTIEISGETLISYEIPCRLARELRSSIFLLGSVLGRMKRAKVAYPGGCDIGLRPINLHLKALSELNVRIVEKYGYIYCDATQMRGANLTLDYPSVGATENVMLLAALSEGVTTLSNAAREPEIVDLQNFLNKMGAKIDGAGTPFIKIEGVPKLSGVEYTTMPDRIVAGTYLIAGAICGGELTLTGANAEHLRSLISKLIKSGCKITSNDDNITIISEGRPKAFDNIETQPYPGFPTDLQAQMTALSAIAEGTTIITENIFETRFKYIPELIKMGAKIKVKDKHAVVEGIPRLKGAELAAMDLRGGASLVLAGLNARETTIINDVQHIERGYENFEINLTALGADILKV